MGASTSQPKEERNESNFYSNWKIKLRSEIDDKASLKHVGYQISKTLGKGSYGKVKRAFSRKHGRNVAIKILDSQQVDESLRDRFIQREKEVTSVVKHCNIVRCFEILECGTKIYMILEYVENGNLYRYLKQKEYLEEPFARIILRGVLSAIAYLHSKNVAHRDLKLENILLTKDLTPKLSDFGFSKKVAHKNDRSTTFCGSRMYSSFEILAGIPYDIFKADIWSLGVILFALLTGHFPFGGASQLVKMKKGASFIGSKQNVSCEAVYLIRNMLQANPNKRLSINDVLRHEWITLDKVKNRI